MRSSPRGLMDRTANARTVDVRARGFASAEVVSRWSALIRRSNRRDAGQRRSGEAASPSSTHGLPLRSPIRESLRRDPLFEPTAITPASLVPSRLSVHASPRLDAEAHHVASQYDRPQKHFPRTRGRKKPAAKALCEAAQSAEPAARGKRQLSVIPDSAHRQPLNPAKVPACISPGSRTSVGGWRFGVIGRVNGTSNPWR